MIKEGAFYCENMDENKMNCENFKQFIPRFCGCCGKTLQRRQSFYCSLECKAEGRRIVERPSKKQLIKDLENLSILKISKKYGVSDNAIRKWCVSYEIDYKTVQNQARKSTGIDTDV